MDRLSPARRLSRIGPLPLHYQIAEELRRRIARGELAPGTPLPSEAELMAEFEVARGTIRQALAGLRADGTVGGARGTPPVVRGPRLAQPFSELLSFSAWVASLGLRPGGRVVEFATLPADVETADALGVRLGEPVHRLVRVRTADGEALMVERSVFPESIGDLVAGVELDRKSIYAELAAAGIVFATARQEIAAIAATPTDAAFLGVAAGTPLLRVRRRAVDPTGEVLEWSEDHYRADRVSLTIDTAAPSTQLVKTLTSPE